MEKARATRSTETGEQRATAKAQGGGAS
jgi:hypothetical protein